MDKELLKEIFSVISEMAFTKSQFEIKLSGAFSGMFGEYMCRVIAKDINESDDWTDEIMKLSTQVKRLLNPYIIKTTFKVKNSNINEVMIEAADYGNISYAKNKIEKYYPKKWKQIKKLNYDASNKFQEMLDEFLPEYSRIFKGDNE